MLAVTSDLSNQDNFLVAMQQSAKLLDRVTGRYPDSWADTQSRPSFTFFSGLGV